MVPLSEVYTLHRFRLQTPHSGSEHVYRKLIPTIICSTMIENYFKQKCFKLDSLQHNHCLQIETGRSLPSPQKCATHSKYCYSCRQCITSG
jgi:hypothetical protein